MVDRGDVGRRVVRGRMRHRRPITRKPHRCAERRRSAARRTCAARTYVCGATYRCGSHVRVRSGIVRSRVRHGCDRTDAARRSDAAPRTRAERHARAAPSDAARHSDAEPRTRAGAACFTTAGRPVHDRPRRRRVTDSRPAVRRNARMNDRCVREQRASRKAAACSRPQLMRDGRSIFRILPPRERRNGGALMHERRSGDDRGRCHRREVM